MKHYDSKSKSRAYVWIKSDKEKLLKDFSSKEDALMHALWIMSRCRKIVEEMEVFYKGETLFHWKKNH